MKIKKISNIFGVGLALIMVFSLAFALVPTKAEAAPAMWTPEVGPGTAAVMCTAAADVSGMAVASDGMTIYVIDNQGTRVLKSPNGGRTFAAITSPGSGTYYAIAVSPDNPNVVAVVDNTWSGVVTDCQGEVYVTRDGGVNWVALPLVPDADSGGAGTITQVMDVAVGPQRATSVILDGRDIAVAVADVTAGAMGDGDIFIIGATLAWVSLQNVNTYAADTFDFTNVEFTPGFLGDRVVAAVGSKAAGGVPVGAGTYLLLINLQAQWGATAALTPLPNMAVPIQATPVDYSAAGALGVLTSDIALPSNFDPTTPGGQKVFVGMAGTGAAVTDVFRVDYLTVRKLGIAADIDINSISYSGDLTGGTLVAGATAGIMATCLTNVFFTVDPMAAFPTFIGSSKPPTGCGNVAWEGVAAMGASNVIVACHPDFQNNGYIFAGTSDGGVADRESALSLSYDGGTSFNQISLIDTTLLLMSDVAVTPDGGTLFLATANANVANLESLWRSPVMATAGSWDRIRTSPADWGDLVGDSIIRLNPGYADAPVVYWANGPAALTAAGVPTGTSGVNIQYSNDGGAVFVARDSLPADIIDIAVEDADTLYAAAGPTGFAGQNTYRSDSAAWNFAVGPVTPGIGPINMIAMAPTYPLEPVAGHLLVGGLGASVAYSTNGAESFAPPIGTGLGASTNMQVVADTDYATNSTIYAASGAPAAAAGIFRFVLGTSSIWTRIATLTTVDLVTPTPVSPGTVFGMVATNGALYAGWNDTTPLGAVFSGAERSLNPTADVGILAFDRMDVGSATSVFDAAPQSLRIDATTSPTLYAIDTTGAAGPRLMSYLDLLATAATTINVPAAGATIPIDPVTGRAMPVTLNWAPMGFSTGLVNTYQVIIFEESQGPAGAELFPVNLAGGGINNPTVDIVEVNSAGLQDIAYTFVGGTSYGIMIRAWNEVSTDQIRSNFCAPVFIDIEASSGVITPTHAGPELTSPIPGTQDIDPGTGFSWNPMAGVTEYELIIATDSGLLSPTAGTPVYLDTTSYGPVDLEYSTDYYYAVKATEPTSSVQTVGHFRTMDEPVEKYTCEYCGLTFDTRAELEAHIAAAHAPTTPLYIWIVIAIGAILVIAVIWLIFTTRRA